MAERWLFGIGSNTGEAFCDVSKTPTAANGGQTRPVASQIRGDNSGNEFTEEESANYPHKNQESSDIVDAGDKESTAILLQQNTAETEDRLRSVVENNGNKGKKLAKKGRRKKGDAGVSTDDLLKLFHLQSGRCALTGRQLTKDNLSIDHIEPFSAGDENHVLDNLQIVVDEANKAKGSMSNVDFIALCRDVAKRYPEPA